MDHPVKYFGFLSAETRTTIKKYSLAIFCLFLMQIALFSIYINRAFSSDQRHTLSVYIQAKMLSCCELTSGIKVKKNILGKEFSLSAKAMYDALNDPFVKPEIDNLINETYDCVYLSSCVYILLLCFFFMRKKNVEFESKSMEIETPKTHFELPSENIPTERTESKKAINENSMREKELKKDREIPASDPTRQPTISKKSDTHINEKTIDDDGFTADDFLL